MILNQDRALRLAPKKRGVDELEEIPLERNTKEDLYWTLQCIQGKEAFWSR